jgi:hypothetical protein
MFQKPLSVVGSTASVARWPRSCARRAIAKVKQRSHKSVIGWVTKNYYIELLRAPRAR